LPGPQRGAFGLPAAFAVAFLLLAAGARPADAADPILLGEIDSRTGLLAAQGLAIAQGVRIAVDHVNAGGGVGGRPLRLLERDDEGKAERAIAAAEELVSRHGVVALLGGYVDSLVGPVSEVAERAQVPYLAAASLDERLTARGYRYFFRISSLGPYVTSTVGVVRDLIRARRVAILHATTPGATQLAARQRTELQAAGIEVVVFEPFTPGLSDFAPLLRRVRDARTDVLVSNAFFADHLLTVRQLAQGGIRLPGFLGTFGLEFPEAIRELGGAAEGLLGTTAWQPDVHVPAAPAESSAFVKAYRERFGREPVPLSMHGYAAARALIAALGAALGGGRSLTADAVRDALARVDVETPLGRVRFTPQGDPLGYERVIVQVQRGRHVVVYPRGVATAPLVHPRP
jgi:branched-chain amino acid transport system substrate-binding protein